jgi:hypothetical protein
LAHSFPVATELLVTRPRLAGRWKVLGSRLGEAKIRRKLTFASQDAKPAGTISFAFFFGIVEVIARCTIGDAMTALIALPPGEAT